MKIYVVMSTKNDESTICNKAFYDYVKAWKHAQDSEDNWGCFFRILHIELED